MDRSFGLLPSLRSRIDREIDHEDLKELLARFPHKEERSPPFGLVYCRSEIICPGPFTELRLSRQRERCTLPQCLVPCDRRSPV